MSSPASVCRVHTSTDPPLLPTRTTSRPPDRRTTIHPDGPSRATALYLSSAALRRTSSLHPCDPAPIAFAFPDWIRLIHHPHHQKRDSPCSPFRLGPQRPRTAPRALPSTVAVTPPTSSRSASASHLASPAPSSVAPAPRRTAAAEPATPHHPPPPRSPTAWGRCRFDDRRTDIGRGSDVLPVGRTASGGRIPPWIPSPSSRGSSCSSSSPSR